MKHKLFTLFLALAASVGTIFAQSGTCGDNLTWNLTNGTLTISGTGEMEDYNNLMNVPWYVYRDNISSIKIAYGVTSIGRNAFYLTSSLTSVEISNSVTTIGENAFGSCSSITSIEIPNSVTTIIGSAFSHCNGLTSIEIPCSVTRIDPEAFSFCSNLNSIIVDQNSNNYCSKDGVLFNKEVTTIIICPNGKQGAYIIPNSVTSIGMRAFNDCSGLTSIEIPNSVTSIGISAFYDCSGLTSVIIPNSVTSIGNYAFYNCTGLTSVTCKAATPPTCGSNVFKNVNISIPLYVPVQGITAYQAANGWKVFTNILQIEGFETPEPCLIASGTCGENLTWTLTCDSVLTISGIGAMESYTSKRAPWYNYRYSITSAIIENGVTNVGGYAFYYCSALKTAMIGNSVTYIGNKAFYGCWSLTSINIPNSVTSIGEDVFDECYSLPIVDNLQYADVYLVGAVDKTLSSISIRDGTKWIGRNAFSGCSSLTSVTIPNSVTSIEDYAFLSCSNLTYIEIPNSVTNTGYKPFDGCSRLTSVYLNSDAIVSKNYSSDVYSNIKSIFGSQVENYIIGNEVTSIGGTAFWDCRTLKSVELPNSITSIGDNAFGDCYDLTSIEIPNSVTSIGYKAFRGCGKLASVTIPESVTSIGTRAFESCSSLTSVTIPDSVTSIEDYTFGLCSGLKSVSIGNNTTSIGEYAFRSCSKLTSITIPNSVTSIGIAAFENCSGLKSIQCEAITPPTCANRTFDLVTKSIPVYVPAGSVAAYQAADVWKEFTNIQAIEDIEKPCLIASGTCGENLTWELSCDSVLTISGTGEMTDWQDTYYTPWYNNRLSVKKIIIEEGVISIGKWAFSNCINVSSVTIPNGVTRIADWAFGGGCNMDTLIIPNSVLSIGEHAFYSCTSLKNLTLSSNLLSIGKYAFCYCYNLTSIELPNKLTTLDEGAFRYCSGIASVTIPNSVTSIGIRVFGSCSGLNSIIVASENSNYSSEDGVLFNKDKTTLLQFPGAKVGAYAIPQGVINITQEAFLGSSLNLTSVTIPSSVTSIGEKAFYDCVYFASITCKAVTPPTCGDEVFFEVGKSIPLYVPTGSIEAYKSANVWKEFFNILPIEGTVEPSDSIYNIVYLDQAGLQLDAEAVTLHLPKAPEIEGFTFVGWDVVAGHLEEGIILQAIYSANNHSSTPKVVVNPANPTQKLIRNGNVYILTDDHTYSITGQKIK